MKQPAFLLSLLVFCAASAAHAGLINADLSVTKVDTPDPVTAGTNLNYTITVTNAGPGNAANVSLSDTLPADATFVSLGFPGDWSCITPVGAGVTVTCTNPSMPPSSAVFTLTVAVSPGVAAGTVISNTATVSSTTSDPNPGNESATATTTVEAASADLSVTKVDTPDPVVPGGNITYTITVTNAGPSNVAVSFSDEIPVDTRQIDFTFPPDWSCLAPTIGTVTCSNPSFGVGSAVFTMTIETPSSLTTGAVITNTASVTSSTADPNPGNNSATATTTVAANPGGVSLAKSAFPVPLVPAGGGLLYGVTATNATGAGLGAATVTDTLPAGTTFLSLDTTPAGWSCTTPPVGFPGTVTCSAASFAPGNARVGFFVRVDQSVPAGTVLTNTAHLVVAGVPPITRDASATATVFTPGTLVFGTKTVSGGNHPPGSTLTYTVVLTNNGDNPQADNPGDELTDVLPAGLTLVSATATSGTAVANVGTNTVTWNGSIPAAGSVTITITAILTASSGTISNQASISFDYDSDGINESSAVTDDPSVPGSANPTTFVVGGGGPVATNIPTLNEIGLALLILLLGMGGTLMLQRRL